MQFSLAAIFVMTIATTSFFQTQIAKAQHDDDVAPAPPSIGADIPLTYFGPAPSEVQRELIGPYQLLRSGNVDLNASTITLPLYQGQVKASDGNGGGGETSRNVWYILTDTTDKGNADALGLNWSPKLNYAAMGARIATLQNNSTLIFIMGLLTLVLIER